MSTYTDNNDVDNVSITRDGQGKLKTLFTKLDPNGNLGIYNSAGVEVAYFDSNGNFIFLRTATSLPNNVVGIGVDGGGSLLFKSNSNSFAFGSAEQFQINSSGKISVYDNSDTAGFGLPAIYAENDLTGQTAAVASVCAFTPATNGTFEVGGYLILNSISGGTSPNVAVLVNWTDPENYSQGFWLTGDVSHNGTGQTNFAVTISTAKDFLSLTNKTIRVKANSSITIATVVNGSPTSINYDVGAHIKQIA